MRILFMGTPDFAAVSLRRLITAGYDIVGVVTQPDRPKGRGLELLPSEVKLVALEYQLPLWQPEQVDSENFLEVFRALAPDLVIVVAFGQKITAPILFEPHYGCVNVHGSLLPRYRGAAPIQRAILNGDPETGVTTMYMDEGWDTGDMIYQDALPIGPDETFGELYPKLAGLGGDLLVKTVHAIEKGAAPRIAQDPKLATKALKIKPETQLISWADPAAKIHNQVRGLAPLPGAETFFEAERLKIMETRCVSSVESLDASPGTIIKILKNEGLLMATGDSSLLITRVRPQGKKSMPALDFANGKRLAVGAKLG